MEHIRNANQDEHV